MRRASWWGPERPLLPWKSATPPGLGPSELTTVPDCYLTAVPYLPVPYQFWTCTTIRGGRYNWRELTPYHRATSNFRLATFALSGGEWKSEEGGFPTCLLLLLSPLP